MRHRIEDLGRIRERLTNLVERDIFRKSLGRPKHYPDKFFAMTPEQQADDVYDMIYGIDNIHQELFEILNIAKGDDEPYYWDDSHCHD